MAKKAQKADTSAKEVKPTKAGLHASLDVKGIKYTSKTTVAELQKLDANAKAEAPKAKTGARRAGEH